MIRGTDTERIDDLCVVFSIGQLATYNEPNHQKATGRIIMIISSNSMNISFRDDCVYGDNNT